MAWLVIESSAILDSEKEPEPGAKEALYYLTHERGYRVTVWPKQGEQKQDLEELLHKYEMPFSDIWTSLTKPPADVFIGNTFVTYEGDWNHTLMKAFMQLPAQEDFDIPDD